MDKTVVGLVVWQLEQVPFSVLMAAVSVKPAVPSNNRLIKSVVKNVVEASSNMTSYLHSWKRKTYKKVDETDTYRPQ